MAARCSGIYVVHYLLIGLIAVCSGCPPAVPYMTIAPPKHVIHGKWVIDQERTTWPEAKALWNSGASDPQRGYLELSADGQFGIEDLPDFSTRAFHSNVRHRSGRGVWELSWGTVGARPGSMTRHPIIRMDFVEVDGKDVDKHRAVLWFLLESGDYYLTASIDPNFPDHLTLRKVEDQ